MARRSDVVRASEGRFFRDAPVVPGQGGEPARLLVATPPQRAVRSSSSSARRSRIVRRRWTASARSSSWSAPLALLLAALGGYLLAGAALRPVEAMRRRAAEISSDEPGRRLPLPAAHDEIRGSARP